MDFCSPIAALPLGFAADLQDHLLKATNDLERLGSLLDDSHEQLQSGFFAALGLLLALRDGGPADAAALERTIDRLSRNAKALQFQDMATQLIGHTRERLRACADGLANENLGDDGDGPAATGQAPTRPNPVTQSEMDTGFIELF